MPEPRQNPLPCIEPSIPVCTQKAKNRAVFKRIFESPANCRINAVRNAVHPDRAQQRADCRKQAEAKAVFNYRRNFFCHRIRSPFFPLTGCALRRFPASSVPQPFQHAEHKLTFLNFQKPCKKHVGSHANAAADAKQQNLPKHASAQSRRSAICTQAPAQASLPPPEASAQSGAQSPYPEYRDTASPPESEALLPPLWRKPPQKAPDRQSPSASAKANTKPH